MSITIFFLAGDKLVTPDQSAILISVIGITNTFGRLLFGFLTDHIARNGSLCGLKITALDLNNICVILSGLSVIAAPYCTTYFAVIIDCVLFGLFICKLMINVIFYFVFQLILYFFPQLHIFV